MISKNRIGSGTPELKLRIVGNPEVILGLSMFVGQFVNALLFLSDYPKLTTTRAAT